MSDERSEEGIGSTDGSPVCRHPEAIQMMLGDAYRWCSRCGAVRRYSPTTGNPLMNWQVPEMTDPDETELCEGCGQEATTYDPEGVPLCNGCADATVESVRDAAQRLHDLLWAKVGDNAEWPVQIKSDNEQDALAICQALEALRVALANVSDQATARRKP